MLVVSAFCFLWIVGELVGGAAVEVGRSSIFCEFSLRGVLSFCRYVFFVYAYCLLRQVPLAIALILCMFSIALAVDPPIEIAA